VWAFAVAALLIGAGGLWLFPREVAFREPEPYDLDAVYRTLVQACPDGARNCVAEALARVTGTHGPVASLDALGRLQRDNRLRHSTDGHQLAHVVGRAAAERFGVNSRAFQLCPTTFNYGCHHGYFEYVLGRARSPRDAAALICGAVEQDRAYSEKFKFYCYHGIGHGVMMAEAYDLPRALGVCDTFGTERAREGCWQGVFMENVNAGMRGEARTGVFSPADPLAPCNRVQKKYRHECFVNHAGWLMKVFGNAVKPAAAACLDAPGRYVAPCLQSIGLMVTNPTWQASLVKHTREGDTEKLGWELCRQFPESHRDQCVIGAADNIMNFDATSVSRVRRFCGLVPDRYRAVCHQRIGFALRNELLTEDAVRERCESLGKDAALPCLIGAGL
jgi:hypothetical protein